LTGNSAGLRTALSSRLSHTELRFSLRESHSFLDLPAHTTMASSQGTQSSKMNEREATLTFNETYRSSSESWDTENRRYTRSNRVKKAVPYDTLAYSLVFIHHSHTHKKTHITGKKTYKPDGTPVLCQRTFRSVFRAVFYTVKLHSLT